MINHTDTPDPRPKMLKDMTALERRMLFSSASSELVMPDRATDRSRNGRREGRKQKRRIIR